MPELPEVEVVKLFLEDKLLGKKISKLEILNPKSFIGNPEQVVGQKIVKFSRTGKQLSIHLSNKLILLVHLKMTGQLLYEPPLTRGGPEGGGVMLGHPTKFDQYPNKSTRLIFKFSNKTTLFFNDQRKFGWVQLFTPDALTLFQSKLGLDIFDPAFSPDYFYSRLQKSRRPVKVVLLDQHHFAGIGNIYANDALFLSKIHPSVPANNISYARTSILYTSLIDIMRRSVLAGGSTTRDQKYLRPDGTAGGNQFFFRVYDRAGEPCLKCKTPINRLKLGGRGTFFCPICQAAGPERSRRV